MPFTDKCYKYSSFHPVAAGDEQNLYEEVDADEYMFN